MKYGDLKEGDWLCYTEKGSPFARRYFDDRGTVIGGRYQVVHKDAFGSIWLAVPEEPGMLTAREYASGIFEPVYGAAAPEHTVSDLVESILEVRDAIS